MVHKSQIDLTECQIVKQTETELIFIDGMRKLTWKVDGEECHLINVSSSQPSLFDNLNQKAA